MNPFLLAKAFAMIAWLVITIVFAVLGGQRLKKDNKSKQGIIYVVVAALVFFLGGAILKKLF